MRKTTFCKGQLITLLTNHVIDVSLVYLKMETFLSLVKSHISVRNLLCANDVSTIWYTNFSPSDRIDLRDILMTEHLKLMYFYRIGRLSQKC